MPQKKWKFNIIDAVVIVLILAVVLFLAFKLLGRSGGGDRQMVGLTYQVLAEEQPVEMYETVQKYIPSQLLASGALYDAQVVSVEAKPCMVCTNGQWIEDPDHVNLIFTVTTEVEKTPVLVPTVGAQEIRIGREIVLKTQYMEFDPAYVIDVDYAG